MSMFCTVLLAPISSIPIDIIKNRLNQIVILFIHYHKSVCSKGGVGLRLEKKRIVQFVSIGGILTALTVMLQSSPVFLPAIGLALSPFSTIMIAIAAVLNIYLGVAVLFSST
jgi:hypothetical protein